MGSLPINTFFLERILLYKIYTQSECLLVLAEPSGVTEPGSQNTLSGRGEPLVSMKLDLAV